MLERDTWIPKTESRIPHLMFRGVCAVCGLLGILAVSVFALLVFYSLSYDLPHWFVLLVHVQNTVVHFLLTSLSIILLLKLLFFSKNVVWWIWGTQTPNFESPEIEWFSNEGEVVETARRKGIRFTFAGLLFGYAFPLLGIYVKPFMETVFIREYPDIPPLEGIVRFLSTLPIISNIEFIDAFLSIVHPIELFIVGTVLTPLTLGLWNLTFVFGRSRTLWEQVRENPRRIESLYFIVIGMGVISLGFIGLLVSLSF